MLLCTVICYIPLVVILAFWLTLLRHCSNPPNPELLNAADRRGLLVWDENRLFGDFESWYTDMADMIKRDRNHPSIIWCVFLTKCCTIPASATCFSVSLCLARYLSRICRHTSLSVYRIVLSIYRCLVYLSTCLPIHPSIYAGHHPNARLNGAGGRSATNTGAFFPNTT